MLLPMLLASPAGASVDRSSALHAYARGRLADGYGAADVALSSYRDALAEEPRSLEVARRSYLHGLISGDMALALQAARLLDSRGVMPRDGTLLFLGDALVRKDWKTARLVADRVAAEGNFGFIAPIIRSWISVGEGRPAAPEIDPADRYASLGRRYIDEHIALQALGRGDIAAAGPAINRALALRTVELAEMRLTFAAQLAGHGARAQALALLPEGKADYALARDEIGRGHSGGEAGRPLRPAQGFARLLARLASDISSDESTRLLAIRLARIASFANPTGADARLVLAQLLTEAGHGDQAVSELNKVPESGWFGTLQQTALVNAWAASDDSREAIKLAHGLAQAPGADVERLVRLGQLLAREKDFVGAADAFHSAEGRYAADNVPWALLLMRGSALEQAGRWEEARATLERAAKIAPNEPAVLNYLGYAQVERRQNVPAALELLKKASALKPEDASITDSLGWAHFVTGNVEAAVPVLERAAEGAPADVTVNEHLGDALWAIGRRFEARYAWRDR
ncbi:MAG TPA: tetratricopeptide repeat protein, partial [Sphingobium sp.]|nr:tetratricopeptide repeat protein [Sphingobium sp.]